MERINVAELLKDCPKGMKLDCVVYDNLTFDYINEEQGRIYCKVEGRDTVWFTIYGCVNHSKSSKCVIFPKGKATWEGFVPPCKFKDGDIIYTLVEGGFEFISIFKKTSKTHVYSYISLGSQFFLENLEGLCTIDDIISQRLATEEEKQKLFDAIKENGYKWNAETKKLEKLIEPKFKVGDKIRHKKTNKNDVYEISKVYDDSYGLVGFTWMLYMKYQDDYELVPNKFDINTLVPFESRVLVRDREGDSWLPAIFGCILKGNEYPFFTMEGGNYKQCIPYDKNKELAGTANDCGEYYKTWE